MKTFESKWVLKVAATPIGNLNEASFRLLEALEEAEIILCEDTRVTGNLLKLLEIKNKPTLMKFEKFSENDKKEIAIKLIKDDKKVLLVSDAGYPLISDPGYSLVNQCEKENIAVEVINGPSSIIHSLVVSGLPTNTFMFLGFLGKTTKERISTLEKYKDIKTTFIVLEAVHRLKECLNDLYKVLGNQEFVICRELTKKHEEILHANLKDIDQLDVNLKGEFCLVIHNDVKKEAVNLNDLDKEIKAMLTEGLKTKEISYFLSKKYSWDQKEIYKKVLELKDENS